MRRPLLILSFLTLAAACGPTKEREPNDTFDQAQAVRANGSVEGTISSPTDVDVYSVSVTQDPGVLSAKVGGIRDVDFVLSVFDSNRVELKRYDETSVGGDEQALDIGVHRGTYFIQLSNKNPKANNPGQPYHLEIKVQSAAGNEMEPNDTPSAANPIEPGTTIRGHYFPSQNILAQLKAQQDAAAAALPSAATAQAAVQPSTAAPAAVAASTAAAPAPRSAVLPDGGEEDWFKIHIAAPGMQVLNVDVSEVPKIDPILEVYDSNLYKLKEVSSAGPGAPLALRDFGVRGPVDYYFRLRAKSRLTANYEVQYQLLTELVPWRGSSEFEPNDQRQEATPFDGDSMTGTIGSAGDVDWYKVSVKTEGRQILSASVTALPGIDLVLSLRDELGNPLVTADNGGKEQPETITGFGVGKGDYYLVVSEKTGRKSDPQHTYTLTKTLVPAQPGLEFEPNDSTATAQGIKVGESVDGYLAPKGDVDYYEFNVYQKGLIVAELTGLINVRWSAALFDQEGKELKTTAGKKAGEPISLSLDLDPGTYQIRLSAADAGQVNVRDKYTLRLRTQ